MSDMQFRAVRKRSDKSESEKATDSESVLHSIIVRMSKLLERGIGRGLIEGDKLPPETLGVALQGAD